jgi:hypothetical protein
VNWFSLRIFRRHSTSFTSIAYCFFATQCVSHRPTVAPNLTAKPVNQAVVAKNACGPTALYHSLLFGAPRYQAAATALPGNADSTKLLYLITHHGSKNSQHVRGRQRWSSRGINAVDLADIANELNPPLSPRVRMTVPKGTEAWRQSHQSLARSLRRGFPPVAVLRRYEGASVIESHFITIIAVPPVLTPGTDFFDITYVDPSGGRILKGKIYARWGKAHTQLIADTPGTLVGKQKVHEPSVLLMDSLIYIR